MANIPLRQLPIHAFLGDQESGESLTLAQIHSSGGSRNIWINKLGSIGPILGYSKANPTAVVADENGQAMRLIAMHPYSILQSVDSDFSDFQQILGIFRADSEVDSPGDPLMEIWVSSDTGATWTFLAGFTDPLNAHNTYFAQIGTELVITGVTIPPQRYDGSVITGLNTTQTLTAPTAADGGDAAPLNGNYRWRVIDMLTDGTRGVPRPASDLTNVALKSQDIEWDASTNPLIQSYEIYRTTGADTVYFLAGQVAAGTTTFTDVLSDLELVQYRVLQEFGDAPPFALYCCLHKGRMWYGFTFNDMRDFVFPRRWYYSDPGRPDSVYQDRNFVDCSEGDAIGDMTTGATGDFQDSLVIWLERSVFTVKGTGVYVGAVIDWDLARSNARTGTVNVNTVLKIPAGSTFTDQAAQFQKTEKTLLAYLTPELDIRLFDGETDTIISYPVADTLKTLNYAKRGRSRAFLDDSRSEAIWLIPADGASRPSVAVVWNYRHGVWFVRDWPFACAISFAQRDDPKVLLAGEGDIEIGGFAYRLWNGRTTAAGDSIVSQWMSKTLYGLARPGEMESQGESFSYDKRWRWADVLLGLTGPLNLEIAWLAAEAENDAEPIALTTVSPGVSALVTSDGSPILTSDGSAIVVANVQQGIVRRAFLQDASGEYWHGRGVRLRIRAST